MQEHHRALADKHVRPLGPPAGTRRALEHYLTTSRVDEPDGTVKQAIHMTLPEPDFDVVRSLLTRCATSKSLVATHAFDESDTLVAFTLDTPHEAIGAAMPDGRGAVMPVLTFYSDLIEASSHRLWAPSSYPLTGAVRLQLLEGRLRLMRFADLASSRGLALPYRAGDGGYAMDEEGPQCSPGQGAVQPARPPGSRVLLGNDVEALFPAR